MDLRRFLSVPGSIIAPHAENGRDGLAPSDRRPGGGVNVAMGEGVQTGAQHHVLPKPR